MTTSILTALQLDAAAGLLQNQGIGINANLTTAIASYEANPLIAPLLETIAIGSGNVGNVGTLLSGNTVYTLETIAANTCPALSDSVPTAYSSSLGNTMTDAVLAEANRDICGTNVSKLTQAVNQASAYASQTTVFINSAKNSQTYLGNTFTTINSMITGGVTTINLATTAFGQDLINLGQLINLRDLNNLGSPLSLIQQIYSITGAIPVVSIYFVAAGIPSNVILSLTDPSASVADSIQALMYRAMTQITGDNLNQILTVMGVKTVGINNMADLLNPVKLFPNSFQSLTVGGTAFKRTIPIYVNSSGSVNETLKTELPDYVMSSLV